MRKFETSLAEFCKNSGLEYLLEEYSPDNKLPPSQIGAHSLTPVKWVCAFGHEETDSPAHRLKRKYCTICGKLRSGSFAQCHPELLKYWSSDNTVQPDRIPPTYSKFIIWKCEQGHTWSRRISLQAKLKNCPYCNIKRTGFFACRPEMLEEWDYEKNAGIEPDTVPAFSNQKYHWLCPNGHSYTAAPEKLMRHSTRCPICSSFGYIRPDLLGEWHPTKNGGKTPYDYSAKSQHNAWFICPICGKEYTARIANRAKRESPSCPNCR